MKKIKLILIHLADMFDYYVLHGILDSRLVNYFWNHNWYNSLQDSHMKVCTKICLSEWWGDHNCECKYCKSMQYTDIENEDE